MKPKDMKDFRITWDNRSCTWVVARNDLEGDYHAHFAEKKGCFKLIALYNKKLQPFEIYFNIAMQRITTPEEWSTFTPKQPKDKFKKKQKHMLKR